MNTRKINIPAVRNLSGVFLTVFEREFIANEVVVYLAKKNDCLTVVISQVSDGFYELDAIRPVKEGYTVEEIIRELDRDLTFEGYTNQVWYVCQLSKSFRTVMVKEVRR